MEVRIIRQVTALAIIGLCGWPLWQGYNVVAKDGRMSSRGPPSVVFRLGNSL